MKISGLKFLALGGIAGPILFTSVVLFCSSQRPDYDQTSQFIDELGASGTPNSMLMNTVGFLLSGLMIAAFGISLLLGLPSRSATRIGSVFIILFGIGMGVSGFFSCDPGCPPEGSWSARIHDQVSGATFVSAVVGTLLMGISFRKMSRMRSIWFYSVITSLVSFGILIVLIDSVDSSSMVGLWQRLMLLLFFAWFGVTGIRVIRQY